MRSLPIPTQSRNYRLIILYYILNIILSLLYIPLAILLIIHTPYIYLSLTFPFTAHLDISILVKVCLTLGVIVYFIGLLLTNTNLILLSVFITHTLFVIIVSSSHLLTSYIGFFPSSNTYGIGLQMLILAIAYLLLNNLLLRSKVGKIRVHTVKRYTMIELLNIALLILSPVILTFFFLILGNRIFEVLAELISKLPEPINRIIYVYLFNPYSQLFTLLAILGAIIWLLKNILEPLILYLRLGVDVAKQMIYSEFNSMRRNIERKYFKVTIGSLPNLPSIKYRIIIVLMALLLPLILITYFIGLDYIFIFIRKYVDFIISSLTSLSPGNVLNAPRVGVERLINNMIEALFVKFKTMIIWIERILRFLLWWIWA